MSPLSQLSPVSPQQTDGALDGARSGDVSAVTEASPKEPEGPAKTDSGIEEEKAEEPGDMRDHTCLDFLRLTRVVTPAQHTIYAADEEPNTTATSTGDKSAPATASPAASAPNGTPTPEPASDQPASPEEKAAPTSPEEKVSVMHDEPPPIKPAKPAPGMSATSGPLEDFPEGGDL